LCLQVWRERLNSSDIEAYGHVLSAFNGDFRTLCAHFIWITDDV